MKRTLFAAMFIVTACGGHAATEPSAPPQPVGTWTYHWSPGTEDPLSRPVLATDDTHVYVGTSSGIWRAPKAGGPVDKVTDARVVASPLQVTGGFVHWIAGGNAVLRMPVTGGIAEVLYEGDVGTFLVGSDGHLWISDWKGADWGGNRCQELAEISTGIVCRWTMSDATGKDEVQGVLRHPDGRLEGVLHTGFAGDARPVAIHDDVLYFVDRRGAPTLIGTHIAENFFADGHPYVRELSVDDSFVERFAVAKDAFYMMRSDSLRRVPKDGGATTVVARGLLAGGFVLDDGFVYWIDRTNDCLRGNDAIVDGCSGARDVPARLMRAPL